MLDSDDQVISMRTFTYKGFTVEIGELPGPRQAYWRINGFTPEANPGVLVSNDQHPVECGSWTDLELIAKRNVEQILQGVSPDGQT